MVKADLQCFGLSQESQRSRSKSQSSVSRDMGRRDPEGLSTQAEEDVPAMRESLAEKITKRSVVTVRGKATCGDLRAILERQGYLCAACNSSLTPRVSELDHIRPRSDGGGDDAENLQWLCSGCNKAKGTLSMSEFVAMCKRVALALR